jgi:transmembrane secretion effector
MTVRSGGVFGDVEKPDTYFETFLVASWAGHLRQHDRFTEADREVEANPDHVHKTRVASPRVDARTATCGTSGLIL